MARSRFDVRATRGTREPGVIIARQGYIFLFVCTRSHLDNCARIKEGEQGERVGESKPVHDKNESDAREAWVTVMSSRKSKSARRKELSDEMWFPRNEW